MSDKNPGNQALPPPPPAPICGTTAAGTLIEVGTTPTSGPESSTPSTYTRIAETLASKTPATWYQDPVTSVVTPQRLTPPAGALSGAIVRTSVSAPQSSLPFSTYPTLCMLA